MTPSPPHTPARKAPRPLLLAAALAALLGVGGPRPAEAAPRRQVVLVVLGDGADGRRLRAATEGAGLAGARFAGEEGVEVLSLDDGGTSAGLSEALRTAKKRKAVGIVAVPSLGRVDAYWKAAKSARRPIFFVTGAGADGVRNRGNVWHLTPSLAAQAVMAADTMLAPLAARRVAVVHEPTALGRELAAAFARNLSRHVVLAGVQEWAGARPAEEARELAGFEADWLYAAVTGRHAVSFVEGLGAVGKVQRCLFADGNRCGSLLAVAGEVLEGSVFLDGPDPELQGRLGEALVEGLERKEAPVDAAAVRAFEAARRILDAYLRAGSPSFKKLRAAIEADDSRGGVLGPLTFEGHRGIRRFPFTVWHVRKGSFDTWPDGLLPTPGCGPPLGFGRPPPAQVNEKKGRIGYLTFGDGETRTIEQDLLEVGLSTGGADPELDRLVRDEVRGRAIRIAHQLFRREPDGAEVPGWSWGMTFSTEKPSNDLPRSRVWLAIVAGDHPAAGGQVIGSGMVAIYSTFLKRTMYVQRKLDPPLSEADKELFDGRYRWGEDGTRNFRADKIRCLVDGFSSAVGLTLAHEFGHLCGCGHDTEHPTSIMNVVAGAGASWEDAVWIPSHQRSVTTTLGIDGL